ncbi:MAG: siderophore-interacting protein [Pirellulaceae bacterium]|nr:MAG: siderophore-interacting protein [Pirellulaceae bacterium]
MIATTVGGLVNRHYEQLRAIAARRLARERPNHSLQPTALVHETYLRMADHKTRLDKPADENHFLAMASLTMQFVLIDHARARKAQRRGGERSRVDAQLNRIADAAPASRELTLDIRHALEVYLREDPVKAQLVIYRVFHGMSEAEAAERLNISRATAARYWMVAKLRLCALLDG